MENSEILEDIVGYSALVVGSLTVMGVAAYTFSGVKCAFDYCFRNPDNLTYREIWDIDMSKPTFSSGEENGD